MELIDVLKEGIKSLREKPDRENLIEIFRYISKKQVKEMFNCITDYILDATYTLSEISPASSKNKFEETVAYIKREFSAYGDIEIQVFLVCLIEVLNINISTTLDQDFIDKVEIETGSRYDYLIDNDRIMFNRLIDREFFIPLEKSLAISLIGKTISNNDYSDVGMQLIQYFSEEYDDTEEEYDTEDEVKSDVEEVISTTDPEILTEDEEPVVKEASADDKNEENVSDAMPDPDTVKSVQKEVLNDGENQAMPQEEKKVEAKNEPDNLAKDFLNSLSIEQLQMMIKIKQESLSSN